MAEEEKLNEVYYQPDLIWIGRKGIKGAGKNYVYAEKKYLIMVT